MNVRFLGIIIILVVVVVVVEENRSDVNIVFFVLWHVNQRNGWILTFVNV